MGSRLPTGPGAAQVRRSRLPTHHLKCELGGQQTSRQSCRSLVNHYTLGERGLQVLSRLGGKLVAHVWPRNSRVARPRRVNCSTIPGSPDATDWGKGEDTILEGRLTRHQHSNADPYWLGAPGTGRLSWGPSKNPPIRDPQSTQGIIQAWISVGGLARREPCPSQPCQ